MPIWLIVIFIKSSYTDTLNTCKRFFSSADGEFVVTLLTKAAVYHNGTIVWEPPAIYKSYCPINVEFFPFDMQECFMKFGSWTYDGHEVDLRHVRESKGISDGHRTVIPNGVDLCEYYPNVEWDIINVTARRKEKFYPCCPEPYPDITFIITLRRRTLFYTINLIMPCIAISALTVLVFYLPSDSGEKITLSISILLALTVFFLLLSDINPPTSIVIPLIGKYLLFTMIVVTMSIFLTVYTLSVHFRSPATHQMSPWTKRVFTEILPKILWMKRPQIDRSTKVAVRTVNGIEMRKYLSDTEQSRFGNPRKRTRAEIKEEMDRYPSDVRESINDVRFIAEHLKKEDDEKYVSYNQEYFIIESGVLRLMFTSLSSDEKSVNIMNVTNPKRIGIWSCWRSIRMTRVLGLLIICTTQSVNPSVTCLSTRA